MDLFNEVMESTEWFEAPKKFYWWATASAISAVLKDRVFFDMSGNYKVYPNIYVLLYGPSGVRKGPAISLAQDLVTRVDVTRVIDGRSSIEAVIKELGTNTTRPGKPLQKDACGFLVASELSSSIIGNNSAMDIMTNLYDRLYNESDWKYRLKVGESAVLRKPTITWLSGSNEALFKDFVPEKNIHGGLIGRMFVITENKKSQSNSLLFKKGKPIDKGALSRILLTISKLEGEISMSQEVRYELDKWYNEFDKNAPSLNDDTGFVSRVEDFILKLGIIIAAGRRQSIELLQEDIQEAMDVVLPLIVPTKRVVNSIKKNDATLIQKRSLLLIYLANRPDSKDTRERILRNMGLQIDHEDLDKLATYMIQMNTLTIDNTGGQVIYRLRTDRPEVVEFLKDYKK